MADKFKLILPDVLLHANRFPEQVLRQMLEHISGLAAVHHGFDDARVELKEIFQKLPKDRNF